MGEMGMTKEPRKEPRPGQRKDEISFYKWPLSCEIFKGLERFSYVRKKKSPSAKR